MERVIRLKTDTPALFSDISEVIRLFAPSTEISLSEEDANLVHSHTEENGVWRETWKADGLKREFTAKAATGDELYVKRMLKRAVKTSLFIALRDEFEIDPPWGSLTGIRPTRLGYEAVAAGIKDPKKWLEDEFFVSPDRAGLIMDILEQQRGIIDADPDEFDIYIGIPFCVSRCTYCSFSSGEIGDGRLVEPYIEALTHETREMAKHLKRLRPRAMYVGGGTPTSLSADQLDRVLTCARECFPGISEFTVEAGRPDTITPEKLRVIKNAGAERISVNPQTFCDETLKLIGRLHTSEQTVAAYYQAREAGFNDINMDVIAALPGEDLSMFMSTVDKCVSLAPESVTVHSLAIKHSSKLNERGYVQTDAREVQLMIDTARERLMSAGYNPYYLYRQKYMAGNLENVGYCKPGFQCRYNIDNMEETAPVLALGAGAITKWLFPAKRRIERAANLKSIEGYIERADEMIERKIALIGGDR